MGGGNRAVADRAEPFLRRAIDDDDVKASLRQAAAEARKVRRSLSGEGAGGAALRIAADRKVQGRIGAAAAALGDAGARIAEASPKRRRRKRLTTLLGLSAIGGLGAVAYRRRQGSSEPEPPPAGGAGGGGEADAVRPAGSPSPLQ